MKLGKEIDLGVNIAYIRQSKEIDMLKAHKWYFESNIQNTGFGLTPIELVMCDIIKLIDKSIQQEKDTRNELWRIISTDSNQQPAFNRLP